MRFQHHRLLCWSKDRKGRREIIRSKDRAESAEFLDIHAPSGYSFITATSRLTGIRQIDGYSAHTKLAKASAGTNAMTLAGCWAHLRRRFNELHISGTSRLASQDGRDDGRLVEGRG
ncbi:transposase [Mesorhizobium sp. M0904]|uniref:IS66 family transposase n=1 Tax=Mesorhizobium sp. M0904 TaxID=2957022 RepID=UPI0033398854